MSREELRKYLPDSPKELSFLGSSIVRLSAAFSGGLIASGHQWYALLTVGLGWLGHEVHAYFKIHEKEQSPNDGQNIQ